MNLVGNMDKHWYEIYNGKIKEDTIKNEINYNFMKMILELKNKNNIKNNKNTNTNINENTKETNDNVVNLNIFENKIE